MNEVRTVDLGPRPLATYTPVAARMSRRAVVMSVDCTPGDALAAMLESGRRHLVVVDHGGACVGIVAAVAVAASCSPTLAGLATSPPVQLSQHSSMHEAASLMLTWSVDAAAVLGEDGEVIGIITWSDIASARRSTAGSLVPAARAERP